MEKEERLAPALGPPRGRPRAARSGRQRRDLGIATLRLLGKRGLTRIFCEGGPSVAEALIGQGLPTKSSIFTAPEPLGRAGLRASTRRRRAA